MRFAEGIPIQVISNASIAVDTYFFLSGFLLAYIYLKHQTDKEKIKPIHYRKKLNEFFVSIIKRYIRYVSNVILIHANNKQRRYKHDSINGTVISKITQNAIKKFNLTMSQIIIIAFSIVFKIKSRNFF